MSTEQHKTTQGVKPMINVDGHCSPSSQTNYKKYHTCLSIEHLQKLADNYNQHASKKISQSIYNQPKALYKKLMSVSKGCSKTDDMCLLKQNFVQDNELLKKLADHFRPKMRKSWLTNEKEWLNTFDILNVMKQYEDKYKDFEFLGVFPVDFAFNYPNSEKCISEKMCRFTVSDFLANKKKKRFGIVINLDKHDGPGTHWVSLFVSVDFENRKSGAIYFDSGGHAPPKEVLKFLTDLKTEIDMLGFTNEFKFYYNQTQYQKRNTECGMFAMIFIIASLEYKFKHFHDIKKYFNDLHLQDDLVFSHRKHLYSDPSLPIIHGNHGFAGNY